MQKDLKHETLDVQLPGCFPKTLSIHGWGAALEPENGYPDTPDDVPILLAIPSAAGFAEKNEPPYGC
jgi:hypothetical protein